MKPLEMIAEWRRGCSNSLPGKAEPETCPECTRALIEALENYHKNTFCRICEKHLIGPELGNSPQYVTGASEMRGPYCCDCLEVARFEEQLPW